MGQERQYSSAKVGNAADDRRMLAGVTAVTTAPTNAPPKFYTGGGSAHGENISTAVNLRLLTKITATKTATIKVYVWSRVSETWHSLDDYSVDDTNQAFKLDLSLWDGIYLRCTAITATTTLDAWVVAEHSQTTIGAHQPT